MFVASSGGHLSEILKLQPLFAEYEYLLVTEKTDVTVKLKENYNIKYLKYGPNKNKIKYICIAILNILKCFLLILSFRPKTVVSTGAQVGGFMCFIAKIFGKKVIYIESIARVNELSRTGKRAYKFSDKFYVQWEELAKKYPNSEYLGKLV